MSPTRLPATAGNNPKGATTANLSRRKLVEATPGGLGPAIPAIHMGLVIARLPRRLDGTSFDAYFSPSKTRPRISLGISSSVLGTTIPSDIFPLSFRAIS